MLVVTGFLNSKCWYGAKDVISTKNTHDFIDGKKKAISENVLPMDQKSKL